MHQVPATEAYGYQRQILGSTHVDNDDYDRYLQNAVPASGGIRKLVQTAGLTYNGWQAAPWPLADELHPTAWIVRAVPPSDRRDRVRRTAVPDRLVLRPASAAVSAEEVLRRLPGTESARRRPAATGSTGKGLPPNPVNGQAHRVRLEGEALRETQAGYFGLIDHLDEQIGPLVADFKTRSEKAGRPWVIVVTSDHGETARRSRLLPQVRAL